MSSGHITPVGMDRAPGHGMVGCLTELLKCWIKLFLNEISYLLETVFGIGGREFHSLIVVGKKLFTNNMFAKYLICKN